MSAHRALSWANRQAITLLLVIRLLTFFSSASLVLTVTASPAPTYAASPQVFTDQQFALLTNQARAAAGLPALQINPLLDQAALAKAEDMASRGYWDHFRPIDHKAPWDFIEESGYIYKVAGENLARGFKTPVGITKAWINSPSHLANILSPKYREVGFASIEASDENGQPILLTVELFGTR